MTKTYIIIITYLIVLNLFPNYKHQFIDFKYNYSSIILKIKGKGIKKILSSSFEKSYYPNQVYINDNLQNNITFKYNFNETDNSIKLIWNKPLKSCSSMFYDCRDIYEFDFSNFDTSQVTTMYFMFNGCSLLTSLNISNFITPSVKVFWSMFYNCLSLTSLDLSNFITKQVTDMEHMFYDCKSLEYINLKYFDESNITGGYSYYRNMFDGVPDNVVVCINEATTKNLIFPQLRNKTCFIKECSNNWKLIQKKIIFGTKLCIDSCNNDNKYKYEYNGKCYNHCPKGKLNDDNNSNKKECKCELDKCLECPPVALHYKLCTKCNYGYYPIENDNLNIGEYINCYKNPDGYYLDKNESLYKQCFYSCETCEIKGDNITHNCLKCKANYTNEFTLFNNYTHCYINCSYYYYFDNENNYFCTNNYSCPVEFPKLIEDKKLCIKNNNVKDMIQNILNIEKNETLGKEEETQYYNTILDNIEESFTSEDFDTSNLDKGEDEVIETERMLIVLTTSQNQRNNINSNITTVDLGECEDLLRHFYNLTNNETLYMKKIDAYQDGMKIPKIEYDIYAKLSGNGLEKLNLTICKNIKISMTIPVTTTENKDILNSNSGYYNDLCYITTSDSGTDISLKDRKKEFIEGNKMVCQDGCDFLDYDTSTQKAKCSCDVEESSSSFELININKSKLYENFMNINNIANINLLVCYKNLFSKEGLIKNVGFYIIIIIIIFHILCIILFYLKQLKKLMKKIKNIIFALQNIKLLKLIKRKKKENIKEAEKKQKNKDKTNLELILSPKIMDKKKIKKY